MINTMELLENFSVSSLIAGFIFGVIGLWLFRRGKKTNNLYHVSIAIVLMIYPAMTSSPWLDWGIGIALCAGAYALEQP